MLNTSIAGGAYRNPDGSWKDANGQPLTNEQARAAEQHAQDEQQRVQQIATQAEAQALMRNPGALALALQLQGIQASQGAPAGADAAKDGKK